MQVIATDTSSDLPRKVWVTAYKGDPIKIDPVQEFPGNNPPLYLYLFNTLVFRLNPCRIPDSENSV